MRRREFIAAIGAVGVWPCSAQPQAPASMRGIALLMGFGEADAGVTQRVPALLQGMRDLGWTDGQNLRIDYRFTADVD